MTIVNYFKYIVFYKKSMSQKQTTITQSDVSKIAIAILETPDVVIVVCFWDIDFL